MLKSLLWLLVGILFIVIVWTWGANGTIVVKSQSGAAVTLDKNQTQKNVQDFSDKTKTFFSGLPSWGDRVVGWFAGTEKSRTVTNCPPCNPPSK